MRTTLMAGMVVASLACVGHAAADEGSAEAAPEGPRLRFLLQVSDDERARETSDDVAAACAIATGYAYAASCAGMCTSCPSGQSVQIGNPWAEGHSVAIPCDVLVSLTCAQGDGDLDACALQEVRQACEQTLASSTGDDPGLPRAPAAAGTRELHREQRGERHRSRHAEGFGVLREPTDESERRYAPHAQRAPTFLGSAACTARAA